MDITTRLFQKLELADLKEICEQTFEEKERFLNIAGSPPGKYRPYADRLIAICLAQGAAQHFVDLEEAQDFDKQVDVSQKEISEKGLCVLPTGPVISGIKDIDVWFFFECDDVVSIPNVRNCRKSITARLGGLGERTVDCMKKGIPKGLVERGGRGDSRAIIRVYLQHGDTSASAHLSKKSLVGLYPDAIFGHPLWRVKRLVSQSESGET